jgi:hypothetical protein
MRTCTVSCPSSGSSDPISPFFDRSIALHFRQPVPVPVPVPVETVRVQVSEMTLPRKAPNSRYDSYVILQRPERECRLSLLHRSLLLIVARTRARSSTLSSPSPCHGGANRLPTNVSVAFIVATLTSLSFQLRSGTSTISSASLCACTSTLSSARSCTRPCSSKSFYQI